MFAKDILRWIDKERLHYSESEVFDKIVKILKEEAKKEEAFENTLEHYFRILHERYQLEHPCPKCGSHNTDCELHGAWCNDCGWKEY